MPHCTRLFTRTSRVWNNSYTRQRLTTNQHKLARGIALTGYRLPIRSENPVGAHSWDSCIKLKQIHQLDQPVIIHYGPRLVHSPADGCRSSAPVPTHWPAARCRFWTTSQQSRRLKQAISLPLSHFWLYFRNIPIAIR
jgi:hypothetical protein